MRALTFAFGVAAAAAPLFAQMPAAAADPLAMPAVPGRWTYAPTAYGSDATFANDTGALQLIVRCTRATRRISIIRPSMTAAQALQLWTSSGLRPLPAIYDPALAQLRAEVAVTDTVLDALAYSRARFAVAVAGSPPLVVPNWPEATRAIEDCRN